MLPHKVHYVQIRLHVNCNLLSFALGRFLKKLAGNQCSLITKGSMYHIKRACSAPSKLLCRDFGSKCLQIGPRDFKKLGSKGAFLVHSAISKLKMMYLAQGHLELAQPKNP